MIQWFVVDHGGHPVVEVDAQKLIFELISQPNIARHDFIGDFGLFQLDGDLLAIGSRPEMQVNHRNSLVNILGRNRAG